MDREPVLDFLELRLRETARLLFPVARDEGKRGAVVEEGDRPRGLRADRLELFQEQLALPDCKTDADRGHDLILVDRPHHRRRFHQGVIGGTSRRPFSPA